MSELNVSPTSPSCRRDLYRSSVVERPVSIMVVGDRDFCGCKMRMIREIETCYLVIQQLSSAFAGTLSETPSRKKSLSQSEQTSEPDRIVEVIQLISRIGGA